MASGGESERVAGALARRLGHSRLYPFDEHASAGFTDEDWERYTSVFWEPVKGTHPFVARIESGVRAAVEAGSLWPLWRDFGSAASMQESNDLESGSLLRGHPRDEMLGRQRLAEWRARNLAMASHLRLITARHPGGRILAVVGLGHGGPLRAALDHDQWDLRLVDVAELDRGCPRA